MNLRIKQITEHSAELSQIETLDRCAFPANERRPLAPLLQDKTGHSRVLAFYDGALFCGYASLIICGDIAHIIYFAVENHLRGKGYGSAALAAMCTQEKGKRVIVDIEVPDEQKSNHGQRLKRRQFYLRNGFTENQIQYDWRGETYEILSHGGRISAEEFEGFLRQISAAAKALAIY